MTSSVVLTRLDSLEKQVEMLAEKCKEEEKWRNAVQQWMLQQFGIVTKDGMLEFPSTKQSKDSPPKSTKEKETIVDENDTGQECTVSDPQPADEAMDIDAEVQEIDKSRNVGDTSDKTIEKQKQPVQPVKIPLQKTPTSTNTAPAKILQFLSASKRDPKSQSILVRVKDKEGNIKVLSGTQLITAPSKPIQVKKGERPTLVEGNTEYNVTMKAKNAIKKLEDAVYECQECSKKFENVYIAEGHARQHFETKYKCTQCPLYFTNEREMHKHVVDAHNKVRRSKTNMFTCYIRGCPWTTRSSEALKIHRAQRHTEFGTVEDGDDQTKVITISASEPVTPVKVAESCAKPSSPSESASPTGSKQQLDTVSPASSSRPTESSPTPTETKIDSVCVPVPTLCAVDSDDVHAADKCAPATKASVETHKDKDKGAASETSSADKSTEQIKASTSKDRSVSEEIIDIEEFINYRGRRAGSHSAWQCKICAKGFSNLEAAKTHVRKVHDKEDVDTKEFKCQVCRKAFSSENWLKRHTLMEHGSVRNKYILV